MVAQTRARLVAISWRDLAMFVRPAPPNSITITTGPEGSVFRNTAEKYRSTLARNSITLKILDSEGSAENFKRLKDHSFQVDVGFVQGGLAAGVPVDGLASLGSLFYQPLAIFYRSAKPIYRLSQFRGNRLAVRHCADPFFIAAYLSATTVQQTISQHAANRASRENYLHNPSGFSGEARWQRVGTIATNKMS